jgi:thiamine-monophosphate kinase
VGTARAARSVLSVLPGCVCSMRSEFAFINRIRAEVARRSSPPAELICGIGDDAAVIRERAGRETLITTDLLLEEIDFHLAYMPPRALGHKALAVSLSDIAAMGGLPRYALLTLGIPRASQPSALSRQLSAVSSQPSAGRNPQSDEFWEEFFAGYFALAEVAGVTLIGGDISATPDRLLIDSVVLGDCECGKAVRRGGARAGDGVYLTGEIGRSAAGLELLRRGERIREGEENAAPRALRAHLMPEARLEFGRQVGERALAHAMIDVSDGLAQDLAHICEESGVGAVIDYVAVPVAEEMDLIVENQEAAFALAVSGGEDYELLLTASREMEKGLREVADACGMRLTCIGEIVALDERASRLWLRRDHRVEPLAARGYDHFA